MGAGGRGTEATVLLGGCIRCAKVIYKSGESNKKSGESLDRADALLFSLIIKGIF